MGDRFYWFPTEQPRSMNYLEFIKVKDASEWKPDDPAKIYKRAMIGARQMKGYKTKQNWVLAMDLFIVGSTYAAEICHYAGIDPEGYGVEW